MNLENKTNLEIWNFAKQNGYTIVTFDADFYDLVSLYGHPPKIVWLRLGNASTQKLIEVIQSHASIISSFLSDSIYSNHAYLEIR